MRQLVITRDRATVSARLTEGEAILWVDSCRASNARAWGEWADRGGVPLGAVVAAVEKGGTINVPPPSDNRPTLRIRGINEPREKGRTYRDFEEALAVTDYPHPEPLIEWDDADAVAALDVDYHGVPESLRRPPSWLECLAAGLAPRPPLSWATHGGGLRGIYFARDGYTAAELAACGALSVKARDHLPTVEVKTGTRHPAYRRGELSCGPVTRWDGTADLGAVQSWLRREVAEADVDAWLSERGFERGAAYEHDQCPVAPWESSHAEPVFIGDTGIHCKHCEAAGTRAGSRRPGWFPYAALIPGGVPGVVRVLAENLTHWEHAKHHLRAHTGLHGAMAERSYSALLKLLHGPDDPRVKAVFAAGKDMLRLADRWATADVSTSFGKDVVGMLSELPAVQYVGDKGTGIDRAKLNRFQQPCDLSEWGYPPLRPVRGHLIHGHHLGGDDVTVVVPCRELRPDDRERYRPKYVAERDVAAAWKTIEEVFPGVNREYVQLLIAARGVSEGRIGLPPHILVCGPSGSSKSASVQLAASIIGDSCTEVTFSDDSARVRQQVMEAAANGTFVVFNEVLKEGKARGLTARASLDIVLNLTEDSTSHKLYLGPARLGRLPAMIWTDIEFGQEVKDDTQLARRFIIVRLPAAVDWETTLTSSGVHQIDRFRHVLPRYSEACDAVMSDVIDRFFRQSPRDLKSIARELGFTTLKDCREYEDPTEVLRSFFRAVCDAPPLDGARKKKWPGRGWKYLERGVDGAVVDLWERLSDAGEWDSSRLCSAESWGRLLGVTDAVGFDAKKISGSGTLVRFRVGHMDRPAKVNGEITSCGTSSAVLADSVPTMPAAPFVTAWGPVALSTFSATP